MLHVSFYFADGKSKNEALKKIFDRAIDWYRYTPTCWFLWTSSSAEQWYEKIRPLMADADSFFIVGIDLTERQGWLSKNVWDWLNEDRDKPSK
jgi:hypothetical protein